MNALRLGTRKSALAQAQARWVSEQLRQVFPELQVELVLITTSGDQLPDHPHPPTPSPLSMEKGKLKPSPYLRERVNAERSGEGGLKALFTKEIEDALLDHRIDMAVHSLKDMAAELPKGLMIGAVPSREDPRDVWIAKKGIPFKQLSKGAKVGTGAIRRQAQLRHLRADLELVPLRGNIDTRLRQLPEGELEGILLALAGLKRLGRASEATEILPPDVMLPAVGQGCLAIESRQEDAKIVNYLKVLDHPSTHQAALAERAFLKTLGGSCQTPIAGHASLENGLLMMTGLVISPDGVQAIRDIESGRPFDASGVGERLAQKLLAAGADKLLHAPSERFT